MAHKINPMEAYAEIIPLLTELKDEHQDSYHKCLTSPKATLEIIQDRERRLRKIETALRMVEAIRRVVSLISLKMLFELNESMKTHHEYYQAVVYFTREDSRCGNQSCFFQIPYKPH